MGIYDGLKDAAKVLQEAGKIEQYKEILEAHEKMLEMQDRISDLGAKVRDLEGKLKTKKSLKYERNCYWLDKEGPFCSRCWDSEEKLVHMLPNRSVAYYHCPNCENKNILVYPEKEVHPFFGGFEDFS